MGRGLKQPAADTGDSRGGNSADKNVRLPGSPHPLGLSRTVF